MATPSRSAGTDRSTFRQFVTQKPLQATKLVGIGLTLVLGIAGFFRVLNPAFLSGHHVFADGQFLALLLIPLLGLCLVGIVALETVVSGYRLARSDRPVRAQLFARPGYLLVRAIEAGVAGLGALIIVSAVPVLLADSTPAPAGVGLMLAMMVVGIAILIVSLGRTIVELYTVGRTA